MTLAQEVETALYERAIFSREQTSYLVCSPLFEAELFEECFQRARYAGPPHVPIKHAGILTEFCGCPVLVSAQVERFKILFENKVGPLPNRWTI